MNGYQPKKTCNNCRAFNICKNSKDGKDACNEYFKCSPPPPPKSGSLAITPEGVIYTPPQKQRTVLSVRDFTILYKLVDDRIFKEKCRIELTTRYDEEERKRLFKEDLFYQDLLRIRDKLGELNIKIETPSVEVKHD